MLPLTDEQQELVESHLYVAERATDYVLRLTDKYEFDDVFQLACLGLMDASCLYDPERGVRFDYYARFRALGYVSDWIEHQERAGRSPTRPGRVIASGSMTRLVWRSVLSHPPTAVEQNDEIEGFLQTLKPRNRTLARSLLNGETLKKAGKKIGVSESRASQIRSTVLRPSAESWLSRTG